MRIVKLNRPNIPEWRGDLPAYGGAVECNHYGLSVSGTESACISLNHSGLYINLYCDSLPHLLNFYRDLGSLLDELQPGLTNPLPDSDPNTLDALKVIWSADQLQRGL